MDFSTATYDSVIEMLRNSIDELAGTLARITPALRSALRAPLMPPFVADGLTWCAEQLETLGHSAVRTISDLLEGAAAPVLFFFRAYTWSDTVGAPASDLAADVHPSALRATRDWTGEAADAYSSAVAGQTTAASSVQVVAGSMSTALAVCATAGLAFYVALTVIVVKLIAAVTAAIAAFGSIVFSWAGVLIIVEEAAIDAGLIIAAVSGLVAVLAAQGNAVAQLKVALTSGAAFPRGAWPRGVA